MSYIRLMLFLLKGWCTQLIISKRVSLKWSNRCRKYYENLGYTYTGQNSEFEVNVDDLNPKSKADVIVKCEICGSERYCRYYIAIGALKKGNLCRKCVQPEILQNGMKTLIGKSGSFLECFTKEIGDDFAEKYWSDKNTLRPDSITPNSKTKVWFKCQDKCYHEDYLMSCLHFSRGERCPQCRRGTHRLDSVGGKIDKIYGEGTADERWSSKNTISPYLIPPKSSKPIWLKCPVGVHEDYEQSATNSARTQYDCPMCARDKHKSRLQSKVEEYISTRYKYEMVHEWKCSIVCKNEITGFGMPYDIEIVPLNLLVEVNGEQHYKEKSLHLKETETKEERLTKQIARDIAKKQYALSCGFHFLEIPYWTEKDESYKKLIDSAISAVQEALHANKKEVI